MNFIIFGPPAAGKGTQSKYLQKTFGYVPLSSGDLVRAEIAAGTEIGQKIQEAVEKGLYPSDDIIIDLVKRAYNPQNDGYIFDGFPRTVIQIQVLEELLAKFHQKIDGVFDISVRDEVVKQRILGRYNCKTCGALYNRYFKNPHQEGVCDVCEGREFVTRADDTEAVIQGRLDTYHQVTKPLLDYFQKKARVFHINGEQDPQSIRAELTEIIESMTRSQQTAKSGREEF